ASRKRHYIGQALGLDVEHLDPAAPITARMLGQPQKGLRSPTHAQLLRRLIDREQPCLRELLARPGGQRVGAFDGGRHRRRC
ncbi:hypothetical protein LZB81_10080, partial [Campylobacter jejuni]|nr:hypothetical protein [Campylobacter jejuni]